MRKVLVRIRDGVVDNVIEIEDDARYQMELGYMLVDWKTEAEIGGIYDLSRERFTPPVRVPDVARERRNELKEKFRSRIATDIEVQEYLTDYA